MGVKASKSASSLGFLTVIDDPDHGLFGGYLLLNPGGRPLQFHCTAPIKPNRAQQILYGPTLEAYLYGEQIGQALFEKATAKPAAVCTDQPPAMAVAEFCSCPVLLIHDPSRSEPDDVPSPPGPGSPGDSPDEVGRGQRFWRVDGSHSEAARLKTIELAGYRVAVSHEAGDAGALPSRLAPFLRSIDLAEPFERIRQAIDEARRGTT